MDILQPRVEGRSLLVVGNKIDLISKGTLEQLKAAVTPALGHHDLIFISAVTGEGLDLIKNRIIGVQGRSWRIEALLPLVDKSYNMLSRIRSVADVNSNVADDKIHVIIMCKPEDGQKVSGWIESIPAKVISSQEELVEGDGSEIASASEEKGAPLRKGIR